VNVRVTLDKFVYEVESTTKPGKWYRCDLVANDGAGECACRDFETRRQPAIRRGDMALTVATTCIHLRAAHTHFLREILKELSAVESGKR
jgi:hypothetical protein